MTGNNFEEKKVSLLNFVQIFDPTRRLLGKLILGPEILLTLGWLIMFFIISAQWLMPYKFSTWILTVFLKKFFCIYFFEQKSCLIFFADILVTMHYFIFYFSEIIFCQIVMCVCFNKKVDNVLFAKYPGCFKNFTPVCTYFWIFL